METKTLVRTNKISFLRYPGGKGKLVSLLSGRMPSIYGRYIEPFVGGGALFLHTKPRSAVLADLNNDIIELYRGIKNYPHKVWEVFSSFPSGKRAYYKVRSSKVSHKPIYYRAARTLYLNRTCFKGMWRHNAQGNFNVGYGGEDRKWAITHKNLIELSSIFKKATIQKSDFETTLNNCSDKDFIFLDPPYKPGEREMDHAHYINRHFSFEEQKRLAEKLKYLSKDVNVKWMMTNSSHKDIVALYKEGFYIKRISRGTGRVLGVFSDNPGEVLISNYRI